MIPIQPTCYTGADVFGIVFLVFLSLIAITCFVAWITDHEEYEDDEDKLGTEDVVRMLNGINLTLEEIHDTLNEREADFLANKRKRLHTRRRRN